MEEAGLEHNESNDSVIQPRSKNILSPAVIPGTHGSKSVSQHASPTLNLATTPTSSGRGRPKGGTNSTKSGKNRQQKSNSAAGANTAHPAVVVTPTLSAISQLTIPSSLPSSSASGHQVRMQYHSVFFLLIGLDFVHICMCS